MSSTDLAILLKPRRNVLATISTLLPQKHFFLSMKKGAEIALTLGRGWGFLAQSETSLLMGGPQQPSLPSETEGPATSHPIAIRQGVRWGFWDLCV